MREVMGDDRFMWGSDDPHDEGTYPYARDSLRALFHPISSSNRQKPVV